MNLKEGCYWAILACIFITSCGPIRAPKASTLEKQLWSFTGSYDISEGPMHLKQDGNTVSGTYSIGTLKGIVTGNSLEGTFDESEGVGSFYFVMSDDGRSLRGAWKLGISGDSWNAKRIGAPIVIADEKQLPIHKIKSEKIANSKKPVDQAMPQNLEQKQHISASHGEYRALIIANNKYKDPTGSWSSLKTPIADAKALKDILENHYGFKNTIFLINATRRKMGKALNNLIASTKPQENILIFYAGHGYFDKDITKTGYWVPVDAEGDDNTSFLANSVIRDRVAELSRRCKHVLLVSDSCFSGDLLSRGRGIDILAPHQKPGYFQKKNRDKSCQVLTSGGKEYVDDQYTDSGHSPFAYFLIHKLHSNYEKYLSATELSIHMEKTVANAAGQTPQHGILKTSEDMGGEFFFVRNDK